MPNLDLNQGLYPQVICLGEALIDCLGPLGGDPAIDLLSENCFGGAPANVACGLAKLGTPVAFFGRLGDDFHGQNFRNLMQSRGVVINGCQFDPDRPTRIVLVRRSIDGERTFGGFKGDFGKGFADQAIDTQLVLDTWKLLAKEVQWLVIGSIPLAFEASAGALLSLVKKAVQTGVEIVLDVNWRPIFWREGLDPDSPPDEFCKRVISQLFEVSTLLKLSKEEAMWFFNTADPLSISKLCTRRPDVVVTDGARPIHWAIKGCAGQTNAISPKNVIDTTGAGDAFTAGLIHQLRASPSLQPDIEEVSQMVRFAAGCGAMVCGASGAIEPQPSVSEVELLIASLDGTES